MYYSHESGGEEDLFVYEIWEMYIGRKIAKVFVTLTCRLSACVYMYLSSGEITGDDELIIDGEAVSKDEAGESGV